MKLSRRRKQPLIETLDRDALAEILQELEDEHCDATGERLTTAEFYDRYSAGEAADLPYAIRWASYYELYRAQGQQALTGKKVHGRPVVPA